VRDLVAVDGRHALLDGEATVKTFKRTENEVCDVEGPPGVAARELAGQVDFDVEAILCVLAADEAGSRVGESSALR